jgi:hypothetical protein
MYDSDGEIEEWFDWECNDSETTEEHLTSCNKCSSDDVLGYHDKEERDYQKFIRIDNHGKFHRKPMKKVDWDTWKLLVKI